MKFGDLLKQLRRKAKLLQQELADKSGVSISSIREYEQLRRLPSWKHVVLLSRALGVSVARFSDCDEVSEGADEVPAEQGDDKYQTEVK